MKEFSIKNLKARFFLLFSISSVIPILILCIYAYRSTYRSVRAEHTYSQQLALNRISATLDLSLHQLSVYASVFAEDPKVQALLDERQDLSSIQLDTLSHLLDSDQRYLTVPFKAMCITSKGDSVTNFIVQRDRLADAVRSIRAQSWYPRSAPYRNSLVFLGKQPCYIEHFETAEQYYFYQTLFDSSHNFAGILLLSLNDYTIDLLLDSASMHPSEYVTLLDEKQQVLCSTNADIISGTGFNSHSSSSELLSTSLQTEPWQIVLPQSYSPAQQAAQSIIPFTMILLAAIFLAEFALYRIAEVTIIQPIRKEQQARNRLEFQMLQAQINPHFLYNTLNSIQLMADFMHCENISEAISYLIRLLRYSIDGVDHRVTIEEELAYLESYVYLNNLRYKNRFHFTSTVDPDLMSIRIVKFLFQPIVENSIVHGLRDKIGIGTIHLSVVKQEGKLICTVTDDGIGMTDERLAQVLSEDMCSSINGLSIGIKNIQSRIALLYGKSFGLTMKSQVGQGTTVTITLPADGKLL